MTKKRATKPAAKPASNELIDEGTIEINITGGENAGKHSIDVMSTKIAMEPVEIRHNCGVEGWTATGEFLKDLSETTAKHLGWQSMSSQLAYQLWHKVSKAWVELKKNMP